MMNGEEELVAFEEWLRGRLVIGGRNMTDVQDKALAAVREFARAIDPVPLSESTVKEMKRFEYDAKRRAIRKGTAGPYAIGMGYFREFRDTVLKRRRKQVQS